MAPSGHDEMGTDYEDVSNVDTCICIYIIFKISFKLSLDEIRRFQFTVCSTPSLA